MGLIRRGAGDSRCQPRPRPLECHRGPLRSLPQHQRREGGMWGLGTQAWCPAEGPSSSQHCRSWSGASWSWVRSPYPTQGQWWTSVRPPQSLGDTAAGREGAGGKGVLEGGGSSPGRSARCHTRLDTFLPRALLLQVPPADGAGSGGDMGGGPRGQSFGHLLQHTVNRASQTLLSPEEGLQPPGFWSGACACA